MMSDRKPVKVTRILTSWVIQCETCDGELLSMFKPWMTAQNHHTAMVLARWHVELHEARSCEHCHRTDSLATPEFVDSAHVALDGKLYEIRSTGVTAIGTAA